MNGKDLKKLNRKQLLELLLKQTVRVEELEKQLQEMETKLDDRTLTQQEIGSIAEASLKLNGVFEAAEAAAAQYIENIKNLKDSPEIRDKEIEFLVKKKADAMMHDRENQCAQREAAAEKKIREADLVIAAANKKIAEAQKVIDSVKNTSKTAAEPVKQQAQVPGKAKNDKPKDILDDFFSGVMGK